MYHLSCSCFGSSISAHNCPYLISSGVRWAVCCCLNVGLYSHSLFLHIFFISVNVVRFMQATFLFCRFVDEETINFLGRWVPEKFMFSRTFSTFCVEGARGNTSKGFPVKGVRHHTTRYDVNLVTVCFLRFVCAG